MKEVTTELGDLSELRGTAWIGRGEGSSAVATPLGDVPGRCESSATPGAGEATTTGDGMQ